MRLTVLSAPVGKSSYLFFAVLLATWTFIAYISFSLFVGYSWTTSGIGEIFGNDGGRLLPLMDYPPRMLCHGPPKEDAEAWIQAYKANHERKLQIAEQYFLHRNITVEYEALSIRFAVFQSGSFGMGNRFMGLISTLMFAMLTDRVLLVDWDPSIGSLSDLLRDPGIRWLSPHLLELLNGRGGTFVQLTHTANHYRTWHSLESYDDFLLKNLTELHANEPLVIVRSNQYFLPLLTHNPHYTDLTCAYFGAKPFRQLFSNFIQPIDKVTTEVERFRKEKLSVRNKTLGIQIRNLPGDWKWKPIQENLWWRCAMAVSRADVDTVWFVASPTMAIKESAVKHFGNSSVVYYEPPEGLSLTGNQLALIDIWLLGECDDILYTSYSTFGYMAFGRVGKPPYTITQSETCMRQIGTEPCFHRWYRLWENVELRPLLWTVEMLNQENCPMV